MKAKKIVIPHEHGGWAMVTVPFLIGTVAGAPNVWHIPLFLGWFFLYLSSYPLLQAVKRSSNRSHWVRWGVLYGAVAVVCLIPPLIAMPRLFLFGIPLLALLAVNLWHAKRRSERALVNDLCAILTFAIGGAAAYLLGDGDWDRTMAAVVAFSFLYFTGSVFFVKSVFRERKNKRWAVCSYVYHALLLALPLALGYPWMSAAYLFSAARAFSLAGKLVRPMKVGIIEIAGSVQFVLLAVFLLPMYA
ncbi:YwiC-like family protein [Cohnella fermenti]|uniref:YwiC-like family protein n=1 Tax=Cohnella fermenti TaxID=2565925 RepID=A0A4S4BML1_9BACL|nr:YwiC-like family protein [Cohnella fermenti]THF76073.1 hypothetical protein E6C55_20045 [Cohnella fermenti]